MSIKDERYIQKQLDNLKRKQNTEAYDDLAERVIDKAVAAVAVSYTHLTLPTTSRV